MYMRLAFLIAVAVLALQAQTPAVVDGGVINNASFAKEQGVAPGSLVSIFGTELAAGLTQNDTVPLSTSLSNVSVTFNNIPAGLYFVSPGQIGAQLPWNVLSNGATSGIATVVVTRNGIASQAKPVSIVPVAPGIYYLPESGGWAIAINPDGSLAAPANAIPGIATHPAAAGDALQILATGLGAVDSPIANGANSLDVLRNTVVKPAVLVAGQSATVLFSGLAPQFPGVNQVNFVVPGGIAPGTVSLQLQAGGITSTDQVKMALR
jgi:minor extracellular serine protease Vpr